ncbi:MAG: hypothetical protein AB7C95_00965 [Synergistaceae bacterium]
MADRLIADAVLDASLDYIANNCSRQVVLSAGVDTFAEVAAVTLAATAMTSGDFTKSAGLLSGRKVTVATKTGISITATGNATHLALVDDTNSAVLLLVPIPPVPLTSGNTHNIGSWIHEMAAPKAGV